jgi:hypothetical protein
MKLKKFKHPKYFWLTQEALAKFSYMSERCEEKN